MINLSKYFGIIMRCSMMFIGDRLAEYGLAGHHHTYIRAVCENPGISQDALAKRNFINKSNVARQAAILEEDGFVTRTPSAQDKRAEDDGISLTREMIRIFGEGKEPK